MTNSNAHDFASSNQFDASETWVQKDTGWNSFKKINVHFAVFV